MLSALSTGNPMNYLRRAPDVFTARLGYGFKSSPLGVQAQAGSWSAVAELEWQATDDASTALSKLQGLQEALRKDQPKARASG